MDLAKAQGVTHYLHAITDGRDVAPQSALQYLKTPFFKTCDCIASITGRYFAMDRDQRWDRTQRAYDLFTNKNASVFTAKTAEAAIQQAYDRGEKDEFIQPTRILDITIQDNDVVIFANFRADRARQLTQALMDSHFSAFSRKKTVTLAAYVTLTAYGDYPAAHIAYPAISLKNTLGEYLSTQRCTQLRL